MSYVLGSIREDGTGHVRDTLFYRAFLANLDIVPLDCPPPPTRTVKTCPLGVMDPRQTWGVMSGPSTVRDGTRDWDGTEVAYRLPAKPVGSSEVTRTVGQVDPAGQQKVDLPGRVPHI
jgi:hypothetical protein